MQELAVFFFHNLSQHNSSFASISLQLKNQVSRLSNISFRCIQLHATGSSTFFSVPRPIIQFPSFTLWAQLKSPCSATGVFSKSLLHYSFRFTRDIPVARTEFFTIRDDTGSLFEYSMHSMRHSGPSAPSVAQIFSRLTHLVSPVPPSGNANQATKKEQL